MKKFKVIPLAMSLCVIATSMNYATVIDPSKEMKFEEKKGEDIADIKNYIWQEQGSPPVLENSRWLPLTVSVNNVEVYNNSAYMPEVKGDYKIPTEVWDALRDFGIIEKEVIINGKLVGPDDDFFTDAQLTKHTPIDIQTKLKIEITPDNYTTTMKNYIEQNWTTNDRKLGLNFAYMNNTWAKKVGCDYCKYGWEICKNKNYRDDVDTSGGYIKLKNCKGFNYVTIEGTGDVMSNDALHPKTDTCETWVTVGTASTKHEVYSNSQLTGTKKSILFTPNDEGTFTINVKLYGKGTGRNNGQMWIQKLILSNYSVK